MNRKNERNIAGNDLRSQNDPQLPDELDMQSTWDNFESLKNQFHSPDMNKMWSKTKHKLGWEEKGTRVKRMSKTILKYAATIAIPLMIVGIGVYYSVESITMNSGLITVISAEGKRSKLDLPDGSTLWLQPKTTVKYPKQFDGNTREILFTGQAYFDIKSDKEKPFIVKMENLSISVLGTQFYIRTKEKEDIVEAGLISGTIIFKSNTEELTLNPNDIIVFSKKIDQIIEKKDINSQPYRWKNNSIVFDNCPFGSIIQELSEWYSFDYHIDPKLDLTKKVTLTVRDESLYEIAEILKIVVPFGYKISDNRIVYTSEKQ